MDTRIYIMTHKQFLSPERPGYIPLHVGREGKQDLGYPGDNKGDHISEKNEIFCELTGLYWIWKNISCDIAGLCHYRRYFVSSNNIKGKEPLAECLLTKEYIETVLAEYDMIIPNSSMTQCASVRDQFAQRHNIKDLMLCRDIISQKYPSDVPAFDWNLDTNFVSLGNMVVARKEVLDSYCKWLFDILFEVEQRLDRTGYDSYQNRVMGFLSERLFRVWMLNRSLKIKEEQTVFLG